MAELGVLACIPVIAGFLGRLGRFFPLSPLLALRDAARDRVRTAPVVAAVMAAVAGTTAILLAGPSPAPVIRYSPDAPGRVPRG